VLLEVCLIKDIFATDWRTPSAYGKSLTIHLHFQQNSSSVINYF
jgi:hypothetical protein